MFTANFEHLATVGLGNRMLSAESRRNKITWTSKMLAVGMTFSA